jgi:hypothetical protein
LEAAHKADRHCGAEEKAQARLNPDVCGQIGRVSHHVVRASAGWLARWPVQSSTARKSHDPSIIAHDTPDGAARLQRCMHRDAHRRCAASARRGSRVLGLYGEVGKRWSSGGDTKVRSGINASLGVRVKW